MILRKNILLRVEAESQRDGRHACREQSQAAACAETRPSSHFAPYQRDQVRT